MYALRAQAGMDGVSFGSSLLQEAGAALRAAGAQRVKIALNDVPPPANDPYAQMKQNAPDAIVSAWWNSATLHAPLTEIMARFAGELAAYAVMESTILPYLAETGDARSYGATQICLFAAQKQLSREDFLDIWLNDHTNVAVETQTTHFYSQNVISRPLTRDAPPFDAIVEESFPLEALTDRDLYFAAAGDPKKAKRNSSIMDQSCGRFIDFSTITLMMAGEYRLGGWKDFPYGWNEHGRV